MLVLLAETLVTALKHNTTANKALLHLLILLFDNMMFHHSCNVCNCMNI
ncbi:protein of unknown function [Paenibacillus alvei]|uniref:Uncharacterized protein n=1 Tax=Paenibacillus alvei TaxID=44250 RepID=A0A383RB60_PAEAL|nr:protein of unknown function [Paenibacillus alvei]